MADSQPHMKLEVSTHTSFNSSYGQRIVQDRLNLKVVVFIHLDKLVCKAKYNAIYFV